MRRTTILTAAVLAVLLALPIAAQARTNVRVSIADQNEHMFDAPAWKSLKLRTTRYFIRWDAARHPDHMRWAESYVRKARANKVRVLMHISTNDLRERRAKLPSVSQYRREVGKLVRKFKPLGVREWGVWNEANHKTQPTYRSPSRAASYFKTMRRLCRGCTIVGLDILDQAGATRYISRFYRAVGRSYARRYLKYVGIHNYSDTNRSSRRGRGTKAIIRAVRRYRRNTQFWLTETGGVVNFGRSFRCDPSNPAPAERRAASSVSRMFSLARSNRRYIKRLYVYNWTGASCNGFDTGLTRADGSTRPAYDRLRAQLRNFLR
jgi:hypothetical protein